jgi:hypothetical protein
MHAPLVRCYTRSRSTRHHAWPGPRSWPGMTLPSWPVCDAQLAPVQLTGQHMLCSGHNTVGCPASGCEVKCKRAVCTQQQIDRARCTEIFVEDR